MIAYGDNIKIFCGNSNPEFAKTVCKELGLLLQVRGNPDGTEITGQELAAAFLQHKDSQELEIIDKINDNFTDYKTILDAENDAAHVNWGGSWRMPTKEEEEELIYQAMT